MLNLQFFSVKVMWIKIKRNIVPRVISKCLLHFMFKKNIFTANTDWDWVGTITISEKCCCTKNWKVKVEKCCLAENTFFWDYEPIAQKGLLRVEKWKSKSKPAGNRPIYNSNLELSLSNSTQFVRQHKVMNYISEKIEKENPFLW